MSQAWGMGTWSCRFGLSGSSSEGSSPPHPRSSSSRGPPPPPLLSWGQRHLRKALMRVARTLVLLGLSQFDPRGKDSLDPLVSPVDSLGGWESCWVISGWAVVSVRVLAIVLVAIDSWDWLDWARYVAGGIVGMQSGAQGSLVLSGLPGWSGSMMTSELRICKVS